MSPASVLTGRFCQGMGVSVFAVLRALFAGSGNGVDDLCVAGFLEHSCYVY